MTAAPITEEIDTTEPDWALAWQLMHWITPTREPTRDEVRLAAWLLLDREEEYAGIRDRLGLSKWQLAAIAELRATAQNPDDAKAAEIASQLAPSRRERELLCVLRGVSRD